MTDSRLRAENRRCGHSKSLQNIGDLRTVRLRWGDECGTRRFGREGDLFIRVRVVRYGASFSAWPQEALDGRLTKSVTGGGRSSSRGQARLVRGAGAVADRLRRPTQL
jgi:hypothetical protein